MKKWRVRSMSLNSELFTQINCLYFNSDLLDLNYPYST